MMDFDNQSTMPLPETANRDQALTRQQIRLLASDIDNLRQLHQAYVAEPNGAQFFLLYKRVHSYLKRMDELVSSIVLEEEELKQFQENKNYLDTLAFNMAAEFASSKKQGKDDGRHGHGHHHKKEKKWAKFQHKWAKKSAKHLGILPL